MAQRPRLHIPVEGSMGTQQDSLPEWSKGVNSSSTSASCVGSNPTAVIFHFPLDLARDPQRLATALAPGRAEDVARAWLFWRASGQAPSFERSCEMCHAWPVSLRAWFCFISVSQCRLPSQIRCNIVVSISACHAEDPGSIPGGGDFLGASCSLWCVETQQQCVEQEQLHESDTYVVGCLRELSGVRGRSRCLK